MKFFYGTFLKHFSKNQTDTLLNKIIAYTVKEKI